MERETLLFKSHPVHFEMLHVVFCIRWRTAKDKTTGD